MARCTIIPPHCSWDPCIRQPRLRRSIAPMADTLLVFVAYSLVLMIFHMELKLETRTATHTHPTDISLSALRPHPLPHLPPCLPPPSHKFTSRSHMHPTPRTSTSIRCTGADRFSIQHFLLTISSIFVSLDITREFHYETATHFHGLLLRTPYLSTYMTR